jgi:TatD DNase family protein
VIAVGETGLDRSIETPINLQHNIFSRHLSLAEKAGMPVIVHAVKSYPDIIRVYKESKAHVPLIIHGFRGNQQAAGQLLRHGFYLSFGNALLKQNSRSDKVLQNIPSRQLFLETDDTNTDITLLYERAAALRNLKSEQLMEIIERNFKKCFGK